MMRRRLLLAGIAAGLATSPQARADDTPGPAGAGPAGDPAHPLRGQRVALPIVGLSDQPACRIAAEMAAGFTAVAAAEFGYAADIRAQMVRSSEMFAGLDRAFRQHDNTYPLLMVQRAWVRALAAPKWAMPLNGPIARRLELDVPWYAETVRDRFQAFPGGSRNRWAMPLAGDTMLLFVRGDWLRRPGEAEAFAARFGTALPQTEAALAALTWPELGRVLAFFTRPDTETYGFGTLWNAELDLMASASASFIYGAEGRLWRETDGQVEGVLNTQANAAALEAYRALLQWAQPGTLEADAGALAAAFGAGRLFAVLHWAGHAPDLAPAGDVLVVPAPAFPGGRRPYVTGGQSWIINGFADDTQTQVALDFLSWWFRAETQLEFARRGGNPCDDVTLSRGDFDQLQPWFRAYRDTLPQGEALWGDPNDPELVALHEAAVHAFLAGPGGDAGAVLDALACREQNLLFHEGGAEQPPGPTCPRTG